MTIAHRPLLLWLSVFACAASFCSAGVLAASASTNISDVPLPVKNRATPNIMYILDDSGSMSADSMTGTSYDSTGPYGDSYTDNYYSSINKIYYNPNTSYQPGFNIYSTGANAGSSYSLGNAPPTAAVDDPYRSPTTPTTNVTQVCYLASGSSASQPSLPISPVACGTSARATSCVTTSGSCTYGSGSNRGTATFNVPVNVVAFYNVCTNTTPSRSTAYSGTWGTCTRNEIVSGSTYVRAASRTDCAAPTTSGCTYSEEIQNFANWYSYYRTRIIVMNTVMGRAFAGIDTGYNVGFSTINGGTSTFLNVLNFTPTNKSNWYNMFYSIQPGSSTPLQEALYKVGKYYQTGCMGYSTGTGGTCTDGSIDPVKNSCQMNFAILSTDGYWNASFSKTGDIDGANVPTLPVTALSPDPMTSASYKLTAGSKWPYPFFDPKPTSNTLADVAAYFWVTDLRPATACTTGGTDLCTNNVPGSAQDPASWQHMTTFTMGLGANGTMPYVSNYLGTVQTVSTASNGTTTTTNPCTAPVVSGTSFSQYGFYHDLTCNYNQTTLPYPNAKWPVAASNSATAVDDLWHAAVNGHGEYFSAGDPTELSNALTDILGNISKRSAAAAAVTVSNSVIYNANSSVAYQTTYEAGTWTGDIAAYPITTSGTVDTTAPVWGTGTNTAQARMDAMTPSSRRIVTYSGTYQVTPDLTPQGVQFEPYTTPAAATALTTLSSAQQALLNTPAIYSPPGPNDALTVLAFLRGDRSKDGSLYRKRSSVFGDTVDAPPLLVEPPNMGFADAGYSTFKSNMASRPAAVFQGANDGMMHAFDVTNGTENWAYIPNLLMPNLNLLTRLVGFTHHFYVNGLGMVGDVDFSNTDGSSGAANWHTILVSGLGKGGNGVFALDVTTPLVPSGGTEAGAAAKVLWEFPNSSTPAAVAKNVGLSYGKPIIVKTAAKGWVVLVASGYNNGNDTGGDGKGYLFVLNARNGNLIKAIPTNVGDTGTTTGPSGLAKISAYANNANLDSTVTYAYGGDLLGNVWRFDLTATAAAGTGGWSASLLAQLVDSSGATQPVTTAPELGNVSGTRYVYVGTGEYLGDPDVTNKQTQTMYGLIDDLSTTISPLRSNLVQQTILPTSTSTQRLISKNALTTQRGWYLDLPSATGERANTDPVLVLGTLIFTTNIPGTDACTPGGSSWLYALNYQNGGQVVGGAFGGTFLGNQLASAGVPIQLMTGGSSGGSSSGTSSSSGSSGSSSSSSSSGSSSGGCSSSGSAAAGTVVVLVRDSAGNTHSAVVPISGNTCPNRRVSWREVITQ
jgi:type IV pilus assembly protein PilY1